MLRPILLTGLVLLAACGRLDRAPIPFERVDLAGLDGWAEASFLPAAQTFLSTCPRLLKTDTQFGPSDIWLEPCAAAAETNDETAARAFFLEHFIGIKINGGEALVTGYYEPVFEARREADDVFSAPVLSTPEDLISVDLGLFREALAGQRIAGRVVEGRLSPYEDRASIENAPPPTSGILGWMRPDELFFLQIQGSGVLQFPESARRIGYAAQNGHAYHAIGKTLVEEGHLALEDVTMQSIAQWLSDAPPSEAARVRATNPSYVFFTDYGPATDDLGPLGTAAIPLTPRVSAAVDRTVIPLGAPVWVAGEDETLTFKSLTIAQDTGGAIKGADRLDLFIGRGDEAGDLAGRLKLRATLTVLAPKATTLGLEGQS